MEFKNPGCCVSWSPILCEYKQDEPRHTKDQDGNCGNKLQGDSVCNIPGKYSVVLGWRTNDFSKILDYE